MSQFLLFLLLFFFFFGWNGATLQEEHLLKVDMDQSNSSRSFGIENDTFFKDGKPFRILSGSTHYYRIPPIYWSDRLQRVRALGLNTIQTYVPWNIHEKTENQFEFEGEGDIIQFFRRVQEENLLVMLRIGPYICAEWEFGGFPSWMMKYVLDKSMKLRTYDETYLSFVTRWWNVLLPRIKPFLYQNGGPIIMVQVENEYGSYGHVATNPADKSYLEYLIKLTRKHLGNDVIIYTTDGPTTGYLSRGSLPGDAVYTVVDFGPGTDISSAFGVQRQFNPPGKSPGLCSEFYTGWLTHWTEKMANRSTDLLTSSLKDLLSQKGNVNLYMAHGGTSFGFWNGANGVNSTFQPDITSYDYDAPIDETGDHGYGIDGLDKFKAVQKVLSAYATQPLPPEPPFVPKYAYRSVKFSKMAPFFDNLEKISRNIFNNQTKPRFMEEYDQGYGFILYRNCLTESAGNKMLDLNPVRDRAYVFLNEEKIATVYRTSPQLVKLNRVNSNSQLNILVENMGRINFGSGIYDPKGLDSIMLNNQQLTNFTTFSLPMEEDLLRKLTFSNVDSNVKCPVFFQGSLDITSTTDTFISTRGWGKGVIWINGINIGRYWDTVGPQHTLYIPKSFLDVGHNDIIVFELEQYPSDFSIKFVDKPDFDI